MKCGNCKVELLPLGENSQAVEFRTARGTELRILFCSLSCVFWGGVKHAQSAPTTVKAFRTLFPEAVEVRP